MRYSNLVDIYEKLEATTKRLEQTYIISDFLKKVSIEDLGTTVLLLEGLVFPRWDEREIGIASKMMIKAISLASGEEREKVTAEWRKTGDLGTVSLNLIKKRKQVTLSLRELTVKKVLSNLRDIATIEGYGSVEKKLQLVAELLTCAKPNEAKYIVRTILDDMRIGVGEGTIRDAIVWAFFSNKSGIRYDRTENNLIIENRDEYNKYVDAVQKAYDLTDDFAPVAEAVKKHGLNGLKEIKMYIGVPLKVMLALKVESIDEGFERCGKPAEFEFKYDGFRCQIHRNSNDIKIFTRRLENVTSQFPEIIDCIKKYVKEQKFIIDAEAVGYSKKTGEYMPFQNISQRIKRKYDIQKMSLEFPVELNVFDIINFRGKSVVNKPFFERKKILEKMIKDIPKMVSLAKSIVTGDKKEADKFYTESIAAGNEGLMIKKLDATYKPGARVGYMCKLKSSQEPLDLVIIAAEWGEGKRSEWLSSYTITCIDREKFLEVGKVSTGLKEKREEGLSFAEMTDLLRPLIRKVKGKEAVIKPEIVIEVGYEEIQKSPTYSSGFALRFPRVIRLRADKLPEDATTLDMLKEAYNKQKK